MIKIIANNRTDAQKTDINLDFVFVQSWTFLLVFFFKTLGQNPKGEDVQQMPVKPTIKTSIMFYSLDKSTT